MKCQPSATILHHMLCTRKLDNVMSIFINNAHALSVCPKHIILDMIIEGGAVWQGGEYDRQQGGMGSGGMGGGSTGMGGGMGGGDMNAYPGQSGGSGMGGYSGQGSGMGNGMGGGGGHHHHHGGQGGGMQVCHGPRANCFDLQQLCVKVLLSSACRCTQVMSQQIRLNICPHAMSAYCKCKPHRPR
jgi:hypothetical protein